jgi:hypothetical protein
MPLLAKTLTFDADTMWVEFADGRQLGVPLVYFLAKDFKDRLSRFKTCNFSFRTLEFVMNGPYLDI